ncbi:ABC transporter permease [Chloroflexota bacterium]
MKPVFLLSIRQLVRRRRLVLILLLIILPAALAAAISALGSGNESQESDLINNLLDGMLIAVIMPIVTIALATTVFGDELVDRTLSYLVLKPISRWRIALPKFLSAIVICAPLLILSGIVTAIVIFNGDGQAVAAAGVAIFAGVMAYAAIFTWAGLLSTRALGFGLVYVFLWEGVITSYLGSVRYLSVRGYTLAIMHGIDNHSFEEIGDRVIEFPAGIAGSIAVTIVFFFLTVRRLRRMDVP